MRISGLTQDGDWQFGKGRANYLRRSDAIRQNVLTRIRSFANDWFIDVNDGIPWIDMLGTKDNETRVLREIEKRVLSTSGVRLIERLRVTDITSRNATIELSVIDIFDERHDETVTI